MIRGYATLSRVLLLSGDRGSSLVQLLARGTKNRKIPDAMWLSYISFQTLKRHGIRSGYMSEFQEFKAFEKAGWEARATGYAKLTQSVTGSLIGSFVDQLEPVVGLRALELASGPGYGTAEMARRGANVLGTDFAEAMVAEAAILYPDLPFQQEDAENLSFDDESFDLGLVLFGMLHFAHPEQALSEVFRVLTPGGKFTFTVWAPPEDYPIFGLLADAVSEYGELDVGLPASPPAEAFSRIDGASKSSGNCGL